MASDTYGKLFSSITESTVWGEPYPTRLLWVVMLAKADKDGILYGSIPGLARLANITLEECQAALAAFLGPDPFSRTPDNEGRRIEEVDGGWRLLNWGKYRKIRNAEERAAYKREWDRENRPSGHARQQADTVRQSDNGPTHFDTVRHGPTNPTGATPATATAEDQTQQGAPSGEGAHIGSERSDPIPYGKIVEAFNATMSGLSRVLLVNGKRRTLIRTAWGMDSAHRDLGWWKDYFDECQRDPFLNGTGPYGNGHEGWRPDFDYLLRATTIARVVERALDRADRGGRS